MIFEQPLQLSMQKREGKDREDANTSIRKIIDHASNDVVNTSP